MTCATVLLVVAVAVLGQPCCTELFCCSWLLLLLLLRLLS
jgi:hypothetical protein